MRKSMMAALLLALGPACIVFFSPRKATLALFCVRIYLQSIKDTKEKRPVRFLVERETESEKKTQGACSEKRDDVALSLTLRENSLSPSLTPKTQAPSSPGRPSRVPGPCPSWGTRSSSPPCPRDARRSTGSGSALPTSTARSTESPCPSRSLSSSPTRGWCRASSAGRDCRRRGCTGSRSTCSRSREDTTTCSR